MLHYRCYFLDGSDKIVGVEEIEAASAGDALAVARERCSRQNSYAFELWQGHARLHKEGRQNVHA